MPAVPAHADGTYPGLNGRIAVQGRDFLTVVTPGVPPFSVTNGKFHPLWSPDGTRLAAMNPVFELTLMSPDGAQFTTIAKNVGYPLDWSPDGRLIVTDGFNVGMNVVNADGSGTRLLTSSRATTAKFSPDGSTIAFFDSFSGYTSLIGVDGTNQRTLAQGSVSSWTPDGASVLMTYGSQIRVVNATDPTQYRTISTGNASHPRLSPDGTQVAYISNYTLHIVGLDGTNDRQIATEAGYDLEWSPDGTQIAFNEPYRRTRDTPDVMLVNADGTGLTQLLANEEFGHGDLTWGVQAGPPSTAGQELRRILGGSRVKGKPKIGKTLRIAATPRTLPYYFTVDRAITWHAGTKDISKQVNSRTGDLKLTKKFKGKVIKVKFTATWNGHTATRTIRVGKVK